MTTTIASSPFDRLPLPPYDDDRPRPIVDATAPEPLELEGGDVLELEGGGVLLLTGGGAIREPIQYRPGSAI